MAMISRFTYLLGQAESLSAPQWHIRWDWNWPLWATVLATVLAAVWVGVLYSREISPSGTRTRSALTLLRLAALAIAVFMFAQPTLEWFRLARPRLVLLLDQSSSMATVDVAQSDSADNTTESSRLDAVIHFLTVDKQPLIDRLSEIYQLDVVVFDQQQTLLDSQQQVLKEQLRLLDASGDTAEGTSLGAAVGYAIRELPGQAPAAVVMLTDGVETQAPTLEETMRNTRALRVPLYAVAVGSEKKRPDLSLENLLVEDMVFPGDRLQLEATLRATGFAGQKTSVKLFAGQSQTVLAKTEIEMPTDGQDVQVQLALRPTESGDLALKLVAEPLEGEANIENNVVRQVVKVSDKKIRTLLVQASPSYEFRALKSLLERDPAIDLQVLLHEADADYSEVEAAAVAEFPATQQQLNEYDVLILGDVNPTLLPRQIWPMIEQFVSESAGGMIAIAGPEYMPQAFRNVSAIQTLLPIEFADTSLADSTSQQTYTIEPTSYGRGVPSMQLGNSESESISIWQSLPSVQWRLTQTRPKPGAQILATSSSDASDMQPVILRHYVGAGEVLFHATDETWRWRWRTDDRYFARYWGQAVRRLARGRLADNRQGIQLNADRSKYKSGEPVQLQVRYRRPSQSPDDQGNIVVELQGATGSRQEVALRQRTYHRGLYEAELHNLTPDRYEARYYAENDNAATQVTRFEMQQPSRELARIAVDKHSLQAAAELSGGRVVSLESAVELFEDLPAPLQTKSDLLPTQNLWNNHIVILFFVLILTTEWLLRRRFGML